MARQNAPNGSTHIPAGQANVPARLKIPPKLHPPLLLSNKTRPPPQQVSLLHILIQIRQSCLLNQVIHPTAYLGSTLFKYPGTQCLHPMGTWSHPARSHHQARHLPPPNHHQQLRTNLRTTIRIQTTRNHTHNPHRVAVSRHSRSPLPILHILNPTSNITTPTIHQLRGHSMLHIHRSLRQIKERLRRQRRTIKIIAARLLNPSGLGIPVRSLLVVFKILRSTVAFFGVSAILLAMHSYSPGHTLIVNEF
jgi:hypothetical protein